MTKGLALKINPLYSLRITSHKKGIAMKAYGMHSKVVKFACCDSKTKCTANSVTHRARKAVVILARVWRKRARAEAKQACKAEQ